MDLHHSHNPNNPNLYLRQSYISQSGMPRPNLESRIVYREEERSCFRWVKFILGAIAALLVLYFLVGPVRRGSTTAICDADRHDQGVFGWLKGKLWWNRHSGGCDVKEEITSAEDPAKTVTTVKQIRSCPIEGSEGSWWTRWFNWGHSDCAKYHEHDRQIARLVPSIKPFSKVPPSLRDIQTFPSRYAQIRKYANDTASPTLRSDVQFLFDEIDRERNWATVVNNRDITHPDFIAPLSDLDFLLKIRLLSNDLNGSARTLTEKDATIDRLRVDFHGKNSEKNCTDHLVELQKAHRIYGEKKDYSTSRVDSLTKQLRDVQAKIEDSLRRKFSDETGPVGEINRLEQAITVLRTSKLRLEGRIADSASGRLPNERQRVAEVEGKIRNNKADIDAINARHHNADADIHRAKERLDNALMALGTLKYRLSIQLRNAEIKDFLSSLLKKEGSEKSLEQLFSETEVDKKEIIKIVRAVVQRTKGYETLDINLSEEEWNAVIEKDRNEFQEIMKIYHDLKDIIRKYKEVDLNITALKKEIGEKELARNAAELEWKSLQTKTKLDSDRRKNLELENDRLQVQIKGLEDALAQLERGQRADSAELERVIDELATKQALKDGLDRKHQVR